MYTAVIIVHILVSIFLVIVVLLQAGKGASIGASLGGSSSQTLFGSAGPATFLSKITAGCAIVFMMTSLYLTYMAANRTTSSIMKDAPAVKHEAQPTTQQQQPTPPASNTTQDTSGTTPK
ncbi:MAG: preprotein translocase subunit SecG [Deltaproteobacteria bacterium]|nr:preprotein translocase subunit SecG [Deltaproteobacteria bacterium]